jgi:hypothetical protein
MAYIGLTPPQFEVPPPPPVPPPAEGIFAGDYVAAKVTALYGFLPHRLVPDSQMPRDPNTQHPDESSLQRFVTRAVAPGARHLQLPQGTMKWEGLTAPDNVTTQTFGIMIGHVDLEYTWHKVPAIPKAIFKSDNGKVAVGRVNASTFDGRPGGTLLLLGCDVKPHRQSGTERCYDIVYRIRYVDNGNLDAVRGHNYFVRLVDRNNLPVWDRPYMGPSPTPDGFVFKEVEFHDLFRGPFETDPRWVGV